MRSPDSPFAWLLRKEIRELADSRAWWVLLFAMGPLVGLSFISALRTYAEVSGLNGTAAGVGEALAPLIGVWAPTFSACELAAVFLLPFVAIRLAGGDRQSGALKLELQRGIAPVWHIAAKALVLLAAWMVAMLPALSAIALWKMYGGSAYAPELAAVILGHLLNAALTIALAMAMASFTDHPSTAAILTLSFTVGTWILEFFAAVQGGWWERVAAFTPSSMVAEFQHGLVRLNVSLIALLLIATGLSIAALWMRLGVAARRRAIESLAALGIAIFAIWACGAVRPSWDLSEARANSFSAADERALRSIHTPLRIEAHLAPEDPRRADLERNAIGKLRRLLPQLEVEYRSATSIGLFEQTKAGYGEIWYESGGRRTMNRATTAESVLESIYSVAAIAPPAAESEDTVFRGHPLAAAPRGAAILFYGAWPAAALAAAILARRVFR